MSQNYLLCWPKLSVSLAYLISPNQHIYNLEYWKSDLPFGVVVSVAGLSSLLTLRTQLCLPKTDCNWVSFESLHLEIIRYKVRLQQCSSKSRYGLTGIWCQPSTGSSRLPLFVEDVIPHRSSNFIQIQIHVNAKVMIIYSSFKLGGT